MKQQYISEILAKLKDMTGPGSQAKKVEWLQKNDSPTLRLVLRLGFSDNIKWQIPEGIPRYKSNGVPIDYNFASIHTEARKLGYLWLTPESGGRVLNLPKVRLETLFIQMLESLHKDEAAVVVAMKDQTLGKLFPLTKDTVKKSFPGLVFESKPSAEDKAEAV